MNEQARSRAAYLLLLFTVAVTIGGCLSTPERFQPSGLNSSFNLDPNLSFNDYINHYRAIIKTANQDLDHDELDRIVSANQPFELIPDQDAFPKSSSGKFKRGIILIHGLSESPYHMKALAEYFRGQGFLVRAILLPGHGTVPGDMIKVKSDDWRTALDYGIDSTQPLVDQLYLGGYSTGGSLSLLYASEHPEEISGLFLYSPCLKIKTDMAWLAEPASNIKTWLEKLPDRDFVRYESFALNSGAQIHHLTADIKKNLVKKGRQLDIPTFIALSMEDTTVDPTYTLDFFRQQLTNPLSRLLLFSATDDPPERDPRITTINSRITSQKILSSSHLAITLPPDDPHYGVSGDYRNCLHYRNSSTKFKECSSGDNNWFGERTRENLSKRILQRLTWNPFFQKMLEAQNHFLAEIP